MKIAWIPVFYIFGIQQIFAMEYQKIGWEKIPVIGLGTFSVLDDRVIKKALDLGYRHIDTASIHLNEAVIGRVIKDYISAGRIRREDLFITTKLSGLDLYPNRAKAALQDSLRRLQLDYVDLYLIHVPIAVRFEGIRLVGRPTDFISVWKKLEEEVDSGKIRSLGLSNFNIEQIQRVQRAARIQPKNIQVEAHPYFQQNELRQFASENNLTITAYSPLGSPGLNGTLFQTSFRPKKLPDILNDDVIEQIARKHQKSPAQITLRYLIQLNMIVIPKSSNPKHQAENLDIFDFVLDKQDLKDLEQLDKGKKGRILTLEETGVSLIKRHPEYPF